MQKEGDNLPPPLRPVTKVSGGVKISALARYADKHTIR